MMKISFVIPAYNEENYIGGGLDALLKATAGRDAEIIVVDNNSTDRTSEIVARYPTVTLIHEARRGANSAREAGFRRSKGELVGFLDSDTEIGPGWIEMAESEFGKNPKLAGLSGPFIYYDLPVVIRALTRVFYSIAYVLYIGNRLLFGRASVVQGGNYIVRRSALEAIGGHDVSLTFYGDDTDLALRLSKVGEVKFSFDFPIRSSGRRLAKEGAFTMAARYGINNLWIVLFHKPFTTTAREVRLKNDANERIYTPENKAKEWTIVAFVFLSILAVLAGIVYLIYILAR